MTTDRRTTALLALDLECFERAGIDAAGVVDSILTALTEPETVEYAVQCANGVCCHRTWDRPGSPQRAEEARRSFDSVRTDCSPHRVVQRTVGPWLPVEENQG